MALLDLRFRFRSVDRDRQTDLSRYESMRQAIRSGIGAIDREFAAVRSRYEAALVSAAFLCGTDVSDAVGRDPQTDNELRVAEENLTRARQRMQQLTRQRDELEKLERQVGDIFRDEQESLDPSAMSQRSP